MICNEKAIEKSKVNQISFHCSWSEINRDLLLWVDALWTFLTGLLNTLHYVVTSLQTDSRLTLATGCSYLNKQRMEIWWWQQRILKDNFTFIKNYTALLNHSNLNLHLAVILAQHETRDFLHYLPPLGCVQGNYRWSFVNHMQFCDSVRHFKAMHTVYWDLSSRPDKFNP